MSKKVVPPLAVGLFGDWGSGKSFFIQRMKTFVKAIELRAAETKSDAFCRRAVQIEFNAWHYMDSNLWASLVSHIFTMLARKVTPKNNAGDTAALFKNLETARAFQAQANAAAGVVTEKLAVAQSALTKLAEQRQRQEISLSQLRAEHFAGLVSDENRKQAKKLIDKAADALGIPEATRSLESFEEAARNAWSTIGRTQENIAGLRRRGHVAIYLTAIALALVIGVHLLPKVLPSLLASPAVAWIKAALHNLSVLGAVVTGAIKLYTKQMSSSLSTFEAARKKAIELLDAKRKEPIKEEKAVSDRIAKLQANEEATRAQVNEAAARVQELQRQILDVEEGRSLARFLEERITGDDYRKQLGFISVVRRIREPRRDFEAGEGPARHRSDHPLRRRPRSLSRQQGRRRSPSRAHPALRAAVRRRSRRRLALARGGA